MDTQKICSILDSRYELTKMLGSGFSSLVYLVKDLKDNNKEYAAKVFKEYGKDYNNEIEINQKLSEINSSSFVKYITSSVGCLHQGPKKELKPYIIFEFASKGDIISYIRSNNTGLSEKNCKIIFAKILKTVETLHKFGICHRDLKLDNFLFDGDDFNVKLADFAFASLIPLNKYGQKELIKGIFGTTQYAAPEVHTGKSYNGEKVDIFSLGVILFTLKTCSFGFRSSQYDPNTIYLGEKLYSFIKNKRYQDYWKILSMSTKKVENLSEEFKDLFLRLVAFNPNERPTIEEIYNHEWMKEIKDLNEKELREYENDLLNDLKNRELILNN